MLRILNSFIFIKQSIHGDEHSISPDDDMRAIYIFIFFVMFCFKHFRKTSISSVSIRIAVVICHIGIFFDDVTIYTLFLFNFIHCSVHPFINSSIVLYPSISNSRFIFDSSFSNLVTNFCK